MYTAVYTTILIFVLEYGTRYSCSIPRSDALLVHLAVLLVSCTYTIGGTVVVLAARAVDIIL